jgi:hypothetical protein
MYSRTAFALGVAALSAAGVRCTSVPECYPEISPGSYKYVAVFSVDGFHASDVESYVAIRPNSTIAALLETGYEYLNAYTSAPSDSFPGTVAQFTGASPNTTGIFYDDTYDRSFYAPSSGCKGPPGAEGKPHNHIESRQTLKLYQYNSRKYAITTTLNSSPVE